MVPKGKPTDATASFSYFFFLSYAREDLDESLLRFFKDLREAVKSITTDPPDAIAFHDTREIEPGQRWPVRLEGALCGSRSFVPLWSPRYFISEPCGQEAALFLSRLEAQAGSNGDQLLPLIVPILWAAPQRFKNHIPGKLRDIQYSHGEFGEIYKTKGLRYLLHDDEPGYRRFVNRFSEILVEAVEAHPLRVTDPPLRLEDFRSVFVQPEEPAAPAGPGLGAPSAPSEPEVFELSREAPRGEDFLSRVETVLRLRHPKAQTKRKYGQGLAGDYLEVWSLDEDIVNTYPVGAVEHGITDEILASFLAEVDAQYRKRDPGVRSILVYGGELPAERLIAKAHPVRLVSFVAYEGLIDFRGYLARQTEKLEKDPLYRPSLYVSQRMIQLGQEAEIGDALGKIRSWLKPEGGRFIVVLGDFGTGKTFLLHELARQMAADPAGPLPILIQMRSLEKGHALDTLLAAHLIQEGMEQFSRPQLHYMLRQGRIALLFDGFDELALRVTYPRATEHFDTLLEAAKWDAKVVVTSRRQHFLSDQQVREVLGQRVELVAGHRIVLLQPFNDAEMELFLVRYCGGNKEKAKARLRLINKIQHLPGMSKNPRMLGFIAEISEDQLLAADRGESEITPASLYRLLLEKWLVSEFKRRHPAGAPPGLSREDRWRAVTLLALRLWQKTERFLSLAEIEEDAVQVLEELGKPDPGEAAFQIGSGTLLTRNEDGEFSFVHQSILEWLVANRAAEEMKRGDTRSMALREMSPLMADFLIQLLGLEETAAWAHAELAKPTGDVAKKNALLLLQRPGLGTLPERSEEKTQIYLAGQDLSGQDLSGGDLSGADLSGASLVEARLVRTRLAAARLVGADLSEADLTEADLERADLSQAVLSRARLLRANLHEACLDEAVLHRAKLVGAALDRKPEARNAFGAALSVPARLDFGIAAAGPGTAVAFSPDGELLASAEGMVVRLLEVKTGQEIRRFKGHLKAISSLAFHPQGTHLVTGSKDQTVRLFDLATGEEVWLFLDPEYEVMSVAFSPDGLHVAAGYHYARRLAAALFPMIIRILDAVTGKESLLIKKHFDAVASVAFHPRDSRYLASGSYDQTVRLWDVATGDELPQKFEEKESRNWVRSIAFSPDGKTLACGSDAWFVQLLDVATGQEIHSINWPQSGTRTLAFSPDGQSLACGAQDQSVRLFDVTTEREIRRFKDSGGQATSVAFSPDGERLACASDEEPVRLFDVQTAREVRQFRAPQIGVTSLAWSPHGGSLACGSIDKAVRLLRWETGQEIRRIQEHGDRVHSVAFSPDGQTFATGAHDRTARIFSTDTGKEILRLSGHPGKVWSIAFSPDGKWIATGCQDQILRLFERDKGQEIARFPGHRDWILSVVFSPDGRLLASGSSDRTVRLWDVDTGRQLHRFPILKSDQGVGVAFSPDGRCLATSTGQQSTVLLFDVESGELVTRLSGHEDWIVSLAFSPDGQILASGSFDHTVRLWDPAAGREIQCLRGHDSRVSCVSFSPDGQYLASGSQDNTIRLWEVESGSCFAILGLLPEGWVAFAPDGRYKFGGFPAGSFWHTIGLCRFEPGELDPYAPGLRLPDDASFLDLPAWDRSWSQ